MERKNYRKSSIQKEKDAAEAPMRLNKYISHAGICSRREADCLIADGKVKVNHQIITELGYIVESGVKVCVNGKMISAERLVYILLNKPRGYITTTKDEKGRKTVMELIKGVATERVYPVGRLDRNTSGVLLFTNDGALTQAMIHPANKVPKVYSARLDKNLSKGDFMKIIEGVELNDGIVEIDELAYIAEKDKSLIGIEIHSGKNRIIRRLFEHLGYGVERLDRVTFSLLTKKDLPRGKSRYLSAKEVRILKSHFPPVDKMG